MEREQNHEGGCLCGAVRYSVSGPSIWRAVCYCESCTKACGGIGVAWAGFARENFRLLKGSLALFESTPGVQRGFCSRCGTSLTYRRDPAKLPDATDDTYITTRTLDVPDAYPPEEHVFYGERMTWLNVADELPHHERLSAKYEHLQLEAVKKKG
jgi:hypothetical protein